jgi:glycosyltransferase involved in cell wall biosynthesis
MHDGSPVAGRASVVLIVNRGWVAWKFRSRLMLELRDAGYRVILLTQVDGFEAQLRTCCEDVIDVRLAATVVAPFADLLTIATYRSHLQRIRPLAVLTFTIKPNVYGSLAAHWLGVPAICNVTGLGSAQSRRGLVPLIVRRLLTLAFARAAHVYFQNPDDMALFLSQGVVPARSARLLPGSGVDIDYYRPRDLQHGEKGVIVFCMMARLLRDKGVIEFAQAAGRLRAEGMPARFELWGILDEADERCVSKEEIESWERAGHLVFRGPAQDAIQAFAGVDVVVLPSYYPEGTPRTLLEAAALGLPCITSDMPGCRDAVLHERTGLLCRPRDVDSLAHAMRAMVRADATRRSAYGERARKHVVERFDERIVIDAYLRALDSLRVGDAGHDR